MSFCKHFNIKFSFISWWKTYFGDTNVSNSSYIWMLDLTKRKMAWIKTEVLMANEHRNAFRVILLVKGCLCWLRQREESEQMREYQSSLVNFDSNALVDGGHLTSGPLWGFLLQSRASEHEEASIFMGLNRAEDLELYFLLGSSTTHPLFSFALYCTLLWIEHQLNDYNVI